MGRRLGHNTGSFGLLCDICMYEYVRAFAWVKHDGTGNVSPPPTLPQDHLLVAPAGPWKRSRIWSRTLRIPSP